MSKAAGDGVAYLGRVRAVNVVSRRGEAVLIVDEADCFNIVCCSGAGLCRVNDDIATEEIAMRKDKLLPYSARSMSWKNGSNLRRLCPALDCYQTRSPVAPAPAVTLRCVFVRSQSVPEAHAATSASQSRDLAQPYRRRQTRHHLRACCGH
jgi:hypothetical protein